MALAGGVGGAKLLVGLQRHLGSELTAVVNTADDACMYGLHISPDVDIVTYWLAGVADRTRGWGIANDSFEVLGALSNLGHDTWFTLGDKDLATCLFRTEALRSGATLSEATREIGARFGVAATIIPMTDDPVATRLITADGRTLEFQEYFVKERCEPEVTEVRVAGIRDATPAPAVLRAIEDADRVILCPSNPLLSIGPILGVRGIRAALRVHPHVTAVSPIVRGRAIKGPAARLLAATGRESSAGAVALMYEDFIDRFVIDACDPDQASKLEGADMQVVTADTLMVDEDASARLARELLT